VYDITVDLEDESVPWPPPLLASPEATQLTHDIIALDENIANVVRSVNSSKLKRDFMLSFASNPQGFTSDLIMSQTRDLRAIKGGRTRDEERFSSFYHQPWIPEAVLRYFANFSQ